MKTNLIILTFILAPLLIFGNNGKVAYAKKLNNFSFDGNLNEWKNINAIPIDLYLGNYTNPYEDCKATFKSAFNKNKIFFAIEITDNNTVSNHNSDWSTNDAVVIYLNFCHSNEQSGVARIILNQNKLEIQTHGDGKDKCHSFLKTSHVKHKFIQRADKSYYEIAITTDFEIENFQTIGLDFYVLDIDKNEDSETEIYWGQSNFHKYYMPGYLGDLVFCNDSNVQFGNITGQVVWNEKENSETTLPQNIDIESKIFPNFKVSVVLDSLGKFNINLPAGKFYMRSADKSTTPFEQQGYLNQRRINTFDKIEFEVISNTHITTDTLNLRTYSPPEYLFQPKGILLDFTKLNEDDVDNFVENYKSYYDIPAVSLALIKDDKIVYSKNYGQGNPINNETFQENSVFQIASVTKSVFAFIVMRLVEKGVIDLDKPLYKYLPFKQIEHNEGYKLITARLILSHQSGLPNWAWGGGGGWKHGKKADLAFLPGTRYQYSGEGYEYLGRVVEHLTSKSLIELLDIEFKTPLDIDKLYFKLNDSIQQVTGKFGNNITLWNNNLTVGVAHSILTDAKTFAKFVCELGKQQVLSKESYQQMFTPIQPVPGFEHPDNLYWNQGIGLGFFTQKSSIGKAIMHGGNNADFQGEYVYYLDKKVGFVLFTNSNRGHKLGQELGRFLLYGKQ